MKVLLLTPPMTQLNTPYPATAYLMGFLKKVGVQAAQADPALELVLKLFSKEGIQDIRRELDRRELDTKSAHPAVHFFMQNADAYLNRVELVIQFLQGKDPSLALRIVGREFLPEGPRFAALTEGAAPQDSDPIAWAFGSLGVQDRAKYLASLFVDDLADVIKYGIDAKFELSRYGEKLAASAPHFSQLEQAIQGPETLVDRYLRDLILKLIDQHRPTLVGLSVPFPGNVYGALKIGQTVKQVSPQTTILMGGGYVNTELRELKEAKVFDYVDFITLDDGERPFLCLLEYFEGKRKKENLCRTFFREKGEVQYVHDARNHDFPHSQTGTATYEGLPLDRYLSIFEMLNPMHRIWSDGRWNKVTLAHGCYWKKCNFCDVSLDYIGRYDPASADLIVDRIEALIKETGQRGFHFVDEAAPPAVLKAMAERLLARQITITWWGNVRFEKTFTPALTQLLARSGCVAVSGGLEVASDRLLKLMQKGVTVEQVAKVTHAFSQAGIMVHAYLMYGFPTQTEQETVDALERVRQLFEAGCIQSAFWHRFSATTHSPIGRDPEKFGIRLLPMGPITFAKNDLKFEDPTGSDHDFLGEGLRKALYNYMHGAGLDWDVRVWFGQKKSSRKVQKSKNQIEFLVPATKVPRDLILKTLA